MRRLRIRHCVGAPGAEQGDWPALARIWVAAWSVTFPEIDFAARVPWLAARLAAPGTLILVAETEAPLGFASLTGTELDQLAIAPEEFGTGAARTLLDAVKSASPTGLTLSVNRDNPRALRFYEREGFRRVGEGTNPSSFLPILHMAWP